MLKAPFVVFEGIDGCGKTSVVRAISNKFPQVHITREPGGTPLAEDIRNLLLSDKGSILSPYEQMTLFFAARSIHVDTLIEPKRRAGVPVVSDRFDLSTFAFQQCMNVDGTLNVELSHHFQQLRKSVLSGKEPTLYIFLDVDPEEGMRRRALARDQNVNHFDLADLSEQNRRRESYLFILNSIGENDATYVRVVDANKPKEVVIADCVALIEELL
jgi:dTMP kinase